MSCWEKLNIKQEHILMFHCHIGEQKLKENRQTHSLSQSLSLQSQHALHLIHAATTTQFTSTSFRENSRDKDSFAVCEGDIWSETSEQGGNDRKCLSVFGAVYHWASDSHFLHTLGMHRSTFSSSDTNSDTWGSVPANTDFWSDTVQVERSGINIFACHLVPWFQVIN